MLTTSLVLCDTDVTTGLISREGGRFLGPNYGTGRVCIHLEVSPKIKKGRRSGLEVYCLIVLFYLFYFFFFCCGSEVVPEDLNCSEQRWPKTTAAKSARFSQAISKLQSGKGMYHSRAGNKYNFVIFISIAYQKALGWN